MPVTSVIPSPLTSLAPTARLAFVLIEPSHPGNIGSAARAIATMGFGDLRVVSPRFADAIDHPEARAYASGGGDVLAATRVFDRFEAAVADATLVIGLSARTRDFAPPIVDVAEATQLAVRELSAHSAHQVAFAFGTERIGLTIEQAQRCHRLAQIDAEPGCSSLNLAQAVQITAYEMRRALGTVGTRVLDAEQPAYASHDDIERLLVHLREACEAVEFIDPAHPKKLFERLRRLFARARLETEEVQMLRGLCKQMILKARAARRADVR